jgi:hypothetical protein
VATSSRTLFDLEPAQTLAIFYTLIYSSTLKCINVIDQISEDCHERANFVRSHSNILGIGPNQYKDSLPLKEWVRQNKDDKYVPPDLLKHWGFYEDEAA